MSSGLSRSCVQEVTRRILAKGVVNPSRNFLGHASSLPSERLDLRDTKTACPAGCRISGFLLVASCCTREAKRIYQRNSALQPSQNLRTLNSRFSGIRADGANNLDLAIIKNTRLKEGIQLQLRFEGINALNHPQFNPPNTTPSSSAFGQVTETWASPRTVLFAAKILF